MKKLALVFVIMLVIGCRHRKGEQKLTHYQVGAGGRVFDLASNQEFYVSDFECLSDTIVNGVQFYDGRYDRQRNDEGFITINWLTPDKYRTAVKAAWTRGVSRGAKVFIQIMQPLFGLANPCDLEGQDVLLHELYHVLSRAPYRFDQREARWFAGSVPID